MGCARRVPPGFIDSRTQSDSMMVPGADRGAEPAGAAPVRSAGDEPGRARDRRRTRPRVSGLGAEGATARDPSSTEGQRRNGRRTTSTSTPWPRSGRSRRTRTSRRFSSPWAECGRRTARTALSWALPAATRPDTQLQPLASRIDVVWTRNHAYDAAVRVDEDRRASPDVVSVGNPRRRFERPYGVGAREPIGLGRRHIDRVAEIRARLNGDRAHGFPHSDLLVPRHEFRHQDGFPPSRRPSRAR